ncbi:hypothetical protein N9Y42_08955 [Mariniblastus sp.]|nr:hypothetical protein [Mariniblastus sp.]
MTWIGFALASFVTTVAFELAGSARESLAQARNGLTEQERPNAPFDLAHHLVMLMIFIGLAIGMRQAFNIPMYLFFAGFGCVFIYSAARIVYIAFRISTIDREGSNRSNTGTK